MNSGTAKKLKRKVIIALYGDKLTKKERRSAMNDSSTSVMYEERKKNNNRKPQLENTAPVNIDPERKKRFDKIMEVQKRRRHEIKLR